MGERKKIHGLSGERVKVNCYYDRTWQEYQVRVYIDGKFKENSTYHTDDKRDALDTMSAMFARTCTQLTMEAQRIDAALERIRVLLDETNQDIKDITTILEERK